MGLFGPKKLVGAERDEVRDDTVKCVKTAIDLLTRYPDEMSRLCAKFLCASGYDCDTGRFSVGAAELAGDMLRLQEDIRKMFSQVEETLDMAERYLKDRKELLESNGIFY